MLLFACYSLYLFKTFTIRKIKIDSSHVCILKAPSRTKRLGIHALPLNDAVVVGRAWMDMSRQLMEPVFLDMTNVESWVQVE